MQIQKFGGPCPKKFWAKNMQNLGRFYTTADFDREYLRKLPGYQQEAKLSLG